MNRWRHLIFSGLLITIGAIIYILFRESVIFTLPFTGNPESLPLVALPDNILTDILRYQLPDGLWCCAVLMYASTIESRMLRLIAAVMPVGMEFGQLAGFMPGTFDIADLIVYTVITIIFLLKWKRKNSECFATA